VQQISGYLTVNVQPRANDQIALYGPGGMLLTDGPSTIQFSYNGTTVTDASGNDVTNTLTGGSLQAELQFNDTSPAAAADATPGVGVIAKLRAQLSKLTDAFTGSSGNPPPSAFATAFTNAVAASTAPGAPQASANVAGSFFTVVNDPGGNPDPTTFQVNASLLNSTAVLPQTDTQPVADSFNAPANYATSGLSAPTATYADLGAAILSSFQQTANTISAQNTLDTSQKSFYQTALSNGTGVNLDTELAHLISYQNSYAASAHVITVVNQMLTALMSTVQ
jgi:flagellar hook-associated protein 1